MAVHSFNLICEKCGYEIESPKDSDYRFEDGEIRFPYCLKCEHIMSHKVLSFTTDGDYRHVSDSLAIHPDQAVEHRRNFPDVGVLPDGRLEFHSVRSQERYANKCGFDKKTQRSKKIR